MSPFILTITSDFGTPVSLFHKLSRDEDYAFLFESTEGDGRLSRFSLLGVDPLRTISFKNGVAEVAENSGKIERVPVSDPLELLKNHLGSLSCKTSETAARLELPFIGGLVGFMSYGAISYMEDVQLQSTDPLNVPDGLYGLYDSVIIFDQQYRRVSFVSHRSAEHAQSMLDRALQSDSLQPLKLPSKTFTTEEIYDRVSGPFDVDSYKKAVLKTKEFIQEGQAFQIVLAQRFQTETDAAAIDIYRSLQATNPSPYAYILKCKDFSYLGSSPETFVRCQNKQILLRAIAGTRPRGATPKLDENLAIELRENEKEMAEHRMLVDLGRNDLGRVCTVGTIKVGELAKLTKYTHVMHLATEITGELSSELSCFDAFRSCFPAGTVSGAPKVRAMQLLSTLEPELRGVYSGAVGYFDFMGNMDGAIAIRSALVKDGSVHVTAGGGIVYDSDPQMEYEETRNKAKSVLQAVKIAEGKGQ